MASPGCASSEGGHEEVGAARGVGDDAAGVILVRVPAETGARAASLSQGMGRKDYNK